VRYIGCSNFFSWQLCKALWASDVRNLARFECIEVPYSLLLRDMEDELVPLCISENVGICAYNPLAGGLLTGKYDPERPPPPGTRFAMSGEKSHMSNNMPKGEVYTKRYWSKANFEAIGRFRKAADEHGCTMPQFALAWVLANPTVTSAICGVSSVEQLNENLRATALELSDDQRAVCDGVWQQLRPRRFTYGRPPGGLVV
jgi:aryl-alcohol dehydrogenase (NADP+)